MVNVLGDVCLFSEDFLEFCCSKSFHHVCIKMFLYATAEQKEKLVALLVSRKDTALTKVQRHLVLSPFVPHPMLLSSSVSR